MTILFVYDNIISQNRKERSIIPFAGNQGDYSQLESRIIGGLTGNATSPSIALIIVHTLGC